MASACVRVTAKSLLRIHSGSSCALLRGKRSAHGAASFEDCLSAHETKVTKIKNHMKVASEEISSPICTVGIWIDSGSRFENEKNNGVSHMIEHMAFKGTAKKSQLDLVTDAENMGMFLGAHSGREQTAFYAKCNSKDVPRAVEILADIVQNATFSDADITKEKANILKEFQEVETDLTTVVMDYLHATAYQGTPLGRSPLGTTATINGLTRKDLTDFVGNQYKPPRMVLAAAGGVHHEQLVQLADKHFGSASINYEHEFPTLSHPRFTGSEIRARDDDLPLAHIALAVEGPGFSSGDNVALSVAMTLVGSWDRTHGAGKALSNVVASRCAQEEMCHSFQSFNISYHDTGLWGAYFVADRMTIPDFLYNLQGEWMRLCTSVTDFEVERARNQLKVNLLRQLDSTTLTCEDIGRQVLYLDRRVPLDEMFLRIDSVSAATIRDICSKYIYDKCPAIASVGPVEAVPDYNRLRAAMYWMRL